MSNAALTVLDNVQYRFIIMSTVGQIRVQRLVGEPNYSFVCFCSLKFALGEIRGLALAARVKVRTQYFDRHYMCLTH